MKINLEDMYKIDNMRPKKTTNNKKQPVNSKVSKQIDEINKIIFNQTFEENTRLKATVQRQEKIIDAFTQSYKQLMEEKILQKELLIGELNKSIVMLVMKASFLYDFLESREINQQDVLEYSNEIRSELSKAPPGKQVLLKQRLDMLEMMFKNDYIHHDQIDWKNIKNFSQFFSHEELFEEKEDKE